VSTQASYTVMSGYVIDNVTKLWWQQPIDMPTSTCASGCTQAQATAYCASLSLAGHTDWRLPTRIELVSIVDYTVWDPAINAAAFPGTPIAYFWTASPYVPIGVPSWCVNFQDGTTDYCFTTSRVRCVR
jgi:hypothetical protein